MPLGRVARTRRIPEGPGCYRVFGSERNSFCWFVHLIKVSVRQTPRCSCSSFSRKSRSRRGFFEQSRSMTFLLCVVWTACSGVNYFYRHSTFDLATVEVQTLTKAECTWRQTFPARGRKKIVGALVRPLCCSSRSMDATILRSECRRRRRPRRRSHLLFPCNYYYYYFYSDFHSRPYY